jgi:exodeoxyribonuclease VII small subunit
VKASDPVTETKYADALGRLYEIVELVESTSIDVDELEAVVKEAVTLIGVCRSKLAGTQIAVDQALAGLKSDAV